MCTIIVVARFRCSFLGPVIDYIDWFQMLMCVLWLHTFLCELESHGLFCNLVCLGNGSQFLFWPTKGVCLIWAWWCCWAGCRHLFLLVNTRVQLDR
jgi:hypothetical protein